MSLSFWQAGWHGANELKFPDNITPMPLPPYSPELNPVERVWEFLKERFLSHRLHDDYDAIVDAACIAWNKMTSEAGRHTSLTWRPWADGESEIMAAGASCKTPGMDLACGVAGLPRRPCRWSS